VFIVNQRILTDGLKVIFHQKWSESHVTGTWLWSSSVTLAFLLQHIFVVLTQIWR